MDNATKIQNYLKKISLSELKIENFVVQNIAEKSQRTFKGVVAVSKDNYNKLALPFDVNHTHFEFNGQDGRSIYIFNIEPVDIDNDNILIIGLPDSDPYIGLLEFKILNNTLKKLKLPDNALYIHQPDWLRGETIGYAKKCLIAIRAKLEKEAKNLDEV